ncbi:PREDICTED: uncharacterized protein LOC103600126 [Galeopterus variegatus]|uniref:Cytochrome c oxidase subunit 7B, mitochondrial n=1 Tax=Galeopterus variegatus TaxID=482537 RepID=A0ABM0RPN7_GALVR|nr:PREDICTED: uncharacterized protein LOC103600126 [Galeopterus variegatus]
MRAILYGSPCIRLTVGRTGPSRYTGIPAAPISPLPREGTPVLASRLWSGAPTGVSRLGGGVEVEVTRKWGRVCVLGAHQAPQGSGRGTGAWRGSYGARRAERTAPDGELTPAPGRRREKGVSYLRQDLDRARARARAQVRTLPGPVRLPARGTPQTPPPRSPRLRDQLRSARRGRHRGRAPPSRRGFCGARRPTFPAPAPLPGCFLAERLQLLDSSSLLFESWLQEGFFSKIAPVVPSDSNKAGQRGSPQPGPATSPFTAIIQLFTSSSHKIPVVKAEQVTATLITLLRFLIFPLAQNALSHPQIRSIQQTMARQSHQKCTPDFHDKYGDTVLASGATFCIAVWTYTATHIGMQWNLSPAGRVIPKDLRDQ